MYCRLTYVSRGVLPLKTLILYIYRPRGTIQYNQQLYVIYSSYRMYWLLEQHLEYHLLIMENGYCRVGLFIVTSVVISYCCYLLLCFSLPLLGTKRLCLLFVVTVVVEQLMT
jgi:hypothetical protein